MDDLPEANFWPGMVSGLLLTRAFQETSRFSGRPEQVISNRVVRNC